MKPQAPKKTKKSIKTLVSAFILAGMLVITVSCAELLEQLQIIDATDTTTNRIFFEIPDPQSDTPPPDISLPDIPQIGDTGKWNFYQDEDAFTGELEVGALLYADNDFELEVECSQRTDALNVRLSLDFSLNIETQQNSRITKTFEMRLGDDTAPVATQSDWFFASDDEWPGNDNASWLVAPNPVSFTNSLIANNDNTLKIRYTENSTDAADSTDGNRQR